MTLNFHKSRRYTNIPLEVDLVRACARMEMTDSWASWIRALIKADVDWRKVILLASHHRVLPLVYRTLCTHFAEQVPGEAFSELRLAYQANAARNLFLTHELLELLECFRDRGIDAIPIKGPVLSKCVYGDETYRQFDDLDLLVHEWDVKAVSEGLQSVGYTPDIVDIGPEAQAVLKNEGECGFSSACGRVHLDVHWRMAPRSFLNLDHEGLWARSGIVSWDGSPVRVFSPEDLLVLLSIHGMRHLWARHVWILDLAQAVRAHPELDWDLVFDRGKPLQIERFLNVGLLLAWQCDELDLPEWVVHQIQSDRQAVNIVNDLRFSRDFHLPHGTSLMRRIAINTRSREGWGNKVHYFLGQTLSPSRKDWSWIRLAGPMRLLYGLLRPIRVFTEVGIKPMTRRLAGVLGIDV